MRKHSKKFILIIAFLFIFLCFFYAISPLIIINHTPHFRFKRELDLFYYDKEPYDNEDAYKIRCLKWLKTIKIQGNEITDVSFLSDMHDLESIVYWGNSKFVDFQSISACEKLTSFYGGNFELANLDIFQDCINLKTLSLEMIDSRLLINQNTKLNDISSIKHLTNLEVLYINGNNISDISSSRYCSKLTDITLYGTNSSNYSVLINLPNLNKLTIDKGCLTDSEINALKQRDITVIERSCINQKNIA